MRMSLAILNLLMIGMAAAKPPDGPPPTIEMLGPVRMSHYSKPFLSRTAAPAGPYADYASRYTYGTPFYGPYFGYPYCYGCWPCSGVYYTRYFGPYYPAY